MSTIETMTPKEVLIETPQLALVDLDRVICKSGELYRSFCEVATADYGVDASQLKQAHTQARQANPNQPFDGIEALVTLAEDTAINPDTIAERIQEISSDDYAHPDVVRLLERLKSQGAAVEVVTTGTEQFQGLKRKLMPKGLLEGLGWNVVAGSKQQVIEELIAEHGVTPGQTLFIDDRGDVLDQQLLDTGIVGVHLNRPGAKYYDTPADPRAIYIESADKLRFK